MTRVPNVAGVFCEDIREEKSGSETLVGVLPDNLSMTQLPGAMPKLAVYLRVMIDPHRPPKKIKSSIRTPWGQTIPLGEADDALIKTAVGQANANGLPLAGIVLKGLMSPFLVQSQGIILAVVDVDGKEITGAMLNIILLLPPLLSPS
jgi:hypothetical protein